MHATNKEDMTHDSHRRIDGQHYYYVMQRESEAIYVGALTNMAAGESVVTCNVSVPGA